MATGFLAGGTCYESFNEARDVYFSSQIPFKYLEGTSTVQIFYTYLNGAWNLRKVTVASNGNSTVNWTNLAPVPSLPACVADTEFFSDGLTLGLGLLSVAVVSWCFYILRRSIR